MPTVVKILSLVKHSHALSNGLPPSVQTGTKDDKIYLVMNSAEGEDAFETFNQHFDVMFGEDCHDPTSHLQHIHQGKLGMGVVCSYLSNIDWVKGFPLDLVEIKLQWLMTELDFLQ